MTDNIEQIEKNEPTDKLGIDDLVEDIFGLNIRGLKTIWTTMTRPWLYFEAAKTPKWQDRYTPSFRVWFAIIAIGTFLQFFWAGQNSSNLGAYTEIMKPILADANAVLAEDNKMLDVDPASAAKALLKYTQLFTPIGYLICLLVVAGLFQSWRERLSFVVRLRYVFAIVIPGTILGYVSAFATTRVPLEIYHVLNAVGLFAMFLSYFTVAYFGPFRDMAGRGRLGRSLGITTLIIIAVMIASLIATGLAFITIIMTFDPVPLVTAP